MTLPRTFNVTLHQVSDFQCLDHGVLKLSREKGLTHLKLSLVHMGEFTAYVGITKLSFCSALGLCAVDASMDIPAFQFEAITNQVEGEMCLTGLTRLKSLNTSGKNQLRRCFVIGQAL